MQRRRLPVQVEPLSPQRWAKIERGLFAKVESAAWLDRAPEVDVEPPPSRRWLAWTAMAAAVALALGLSFAQLRSGDDAASEAHTSRITTGRDGSHLALHGLALDVEPESTVVVNEVAQGGLLIVVDRGSIVCDVAPRSPKAPLIVQAGAAQVRVVGTRFKVQREGAAARVTVEHGVVEVAMDGRMARVAAGQVWPPPVQASLSPTPTVSGETAGDGHARVERSRAAASQRRPLLASSLALSPQARFERAAALERTSPSAATALYGGLETGLDSWAANALFAHGRLELLRGNQAEARRLLERYLARFPRGANNSDARALLERVR